MKKITIAITIILSCCRINAQIFTGTVYDRATNQPLPDVYVSLNGTIAFSITDNSGKFELTVAQRLNTQLVFSHVAYQMVIIENPFDELPEEIYMEQRLNMLNDVVVSARVSPEYADPFTRQQKLRAFREQFLGTTRAGRSCMIMNEGDIELRYNVLTNTLLASSDNPIVVLNEYLGYLISFTLLDFRVEYAVPQNKSFDGSYFRVNSLRDAMLQKSFVPLNRNDVQRSYFLAMSSFTDLQADDTRIKRRRDDVYEQSSTFFFRNIANNTLEESNFRIYEKGRRWDGDQSSYFTIEDDDALSLKTIRLIPDSDSVISVRYRNRASSIHFHTDALLVDRYGNINQIYRVLFKGLMGEARAGDMLPLDYEP